MSQAKPKKGSVVVLSALSIVLAGAGLRWYLNREPASASAAPQPAAAAAAVPGTTAGTPGARPGGNGPAGASRNAVKVPALAATQFRRDPFASAKVFPPKAVVDSAKPVKTVDVNAEVVAAAKRELRLTAISMGERPLALISGKAYRVGDTVGSFRVERIAPFEVVVEQRGVRVVLSKE